MDINSSATAMTQQPDDQASRSVVRESLWRYVKKNHLLYWMIVPGMLYFVVFKYVPLLGSVIAFQEYSIFKGFAHSDWVGFKWFEQFFQYPNFRRLLFNTLIIGFYQILFSFPAPIILAILLNELRNMAFKRTVQTILYLPHFLSWVIIGGLGYMLLSPESGLINQWIVAAGGKPIFFLMKAEYFRSIIVVSGIWKEMGWNAIIFLAALTGISPSLYEAARIDGAGRFKQLLYITLPGLLPTIMLLLLLKIGTVMDSSFEQIYIFLNPITFQTGDTLDTYTYREGILKGMYSFTTAIGLFKSVFGFILLVLANRASKATTGESIY
ncbi:ABC transporter permease [Paenibacillus cymbidii]|uniref:ABC transporter permease n=1 Tax=Paenibacillus cymbidii TaxID=1639034 RepID=UPI001F3301F7|nr:ABC transporter permease subunit [Paenibacillus cymbidii]